MADRKLHVPAPDDHAEEAEGDISLLFLTGIACVGLAALILYYFSVVQGQASGEEPAVDPEVTGELSPEQRLLKEQRSTASEFDEMSEAELEEHAWKEEEEVAVLRFGPRKATEVLCQKHKDAIAAGTLDPVRSIELLKSLDRRVEFAPWTCMTRLFLAGDLPDGKPLDREMTKFWKELDSWEGNARIPASFLADFRESRDRPAVPEFYHWVRLCALNYDYQAATECRKLLYQIAPQQGTDILAMIEKHLRMTDGELPEDEATLIIDALGRLARNGQPPNWRVVETDELPDYDADLRNATILYLCRFVHTPNEDYAKVAADQLRRTAQTGGRAYDKRILERWLETCRIAFDGGRTSEEERNVPIIASWSGVEGELPDYSLELVQDVRVCERPPNKPIWWCGADRFAGKLEELEIVLARYFIETRYMEWPEPSESLLSPN